MWRNNGDMGGERFVIIHILLWIWTEGRMWGGGIHLLLCPLTFY